MALVLPCQSQNILVWDNDNAATIAIPESSIEVSCSYGIEKALNENGYTYFTSETLPDDLSQFDIIFIILGFSVDCG